MEQGFAPYSYVGMIDGQLIEVVSESELYGLFKEDDETP